MFGYLYSQAAALFGSPRLGVITGADDTGNSYVADYSNNCIPELEGADLLSRSPQAEFRTLACSCAESQGIAHEIRPLGTIVALLSGSAYSRPSSAGPPDPEPRAASPAMP